MKRFASLVVATLLMMSSFACSKKADEAGPKPSELLAPGLAAMEAMDYPKALALFSDAEKRSPYDPKLLYAIAQAHAALGHDMLAMAYLGAHLKSWKDAPGRQASEHQMIELMNGIDATINAMLTMATNLLIEMPEEEPSRYPSKPTAKQRLVEQVLSDLIMANDFENAERLATAHPRGATMAIGAAVAKYYENNRASNSTDYGITLAERILKLEARSPDVHYIFWEELDTRCTFIDVPCPDGTTKWTEPPTGPRETALEGLLQLGLSSWVYWVGRSVGTKRAVALYTEGLKKTKAVGTSKRFWAQLPGMHNVDEIYFDVYATHVNTIIVASPNTKIYELGPMGSYTLTDVGQALRARTLPTGMPGEYIAFDDDLLIDTEGLVSKLSALPPGEAILALSAAGRKLAGAERHLPYN